MKEFLYAMYDSELDKWFPAQQYSSDSACLRALKAVQLPPHLPNGCLKVFRIAEVENGHVVGYDSDVREEIWENMTEVSIGAEVGK